MNYFLRVKYRGFSLLMKDTWSSVQLDVGAPRNEGVTRLKRHLKQHIAVLPKARLRCSAPARYFIL